MGGSSIRRDRRRPALRAAAILTLVMLVAGCSHAGGGAVKAHTPFIQSVSSSSAVVAWVSSEPGAGVVEYGRTPRLGRKRRDARTGRRHAVTLSGLRAGATYYYRVVSNGEPAKTVSFRTAPEGSGSGFTFAVIGDGGDGGEEQRAVAGLLERMRPDFVLHTGDVVYESGAERDYGPHFFRPYRKVIGGVPFFPALGNHDVKTEDGAPYLENFYLPSDNPQNTERYYSFDWGNAHFVALDSELYYDDGAGSPEEQKAWLKRDLAATRKPWKFVFFHRPPYSSSRHGSDERIRADLEPVFDRYGVDVVFNGHDHDYERTVPIRGVTYVVTGGGGKSLYEAGKSRWTAFSRSVYHATQVRVEEGRLTLEAVEPDGTVIDRLVLGGARAG